MLLLLLLPALALASSLVDSDALGGFHRLAPSDAAHLSSEILRLLDLDLDLPAPRPPSAAVPAQTDAPALTSFMQDVYRELGGDEAGAEAEAEAAEWSFRSGRRTGGLQARYNVSSWLENSLHAADLIASVPPDESLHLPPNQRSQRLVFRFDHLRGDLSVISAELRLFRSHFAFAGESMTFILQRMTERGGSLEAAEQLATHLAPGQTGWLELNVTSFARSWVRRPEENAGLRLQLLSARGFPLPPDLLGFETAPHLPLSPFIVASFREAGRKPRRVRRSAPTPARVHRVKRHAWSKSSYLKRNCARRELRVDFKDLNFDQWVIAPRIYSAYYCGGNCPIPLHPAWNITNHSIVQTLLSLHAQQRSSNRRRRPVVPPPCCVPIALQPMKMLYFDRDKRVMLRTYQNMKVKACGCH